MKYWSIFDGIRIWDQNINEVRRYRQDRSYFRVIKNTLRDMFWFCNFRLFSLGNLWNFTKKRVKIKVYENRICKETQIWFKGTVDGISNVFLFKPSFDEKTWRYPCFFLNMVNFQIVIFLLNLTLKTKEKQRCLS